MALEVGSRLVHYDVTALIGEGGMGQVYQARDTKLHRDVRWTLTGSVAGGSWPRLQETQVIAIVFAVSLMCLSVTVLPCSAQSTSDDQATEIVQAPPGEGRIVTPEEVSEATTSVGSRTLGALGWPIHQLMRGMNSGLISFEKHRIQQKISEFQEQLNARGIGLLYGGLGEGSGFGLGIAQEIPPRPGARASDYLRDERIIGLRLMALMTPLSGYQEFWASFETSPFPRSSFIVHTDYQWRRNECMSSHQSGQLDLRFKRDSSPVARSVSV